MNLLYVLLFGMAGVTARYAIGLFISAYFDSLFPVATFGINIVGAFLIGVLYVLAVERSALTPELRLGLMVGFLGGFTTFSSYCLETFRLIEESKYLYAILYWTLSPVFGLIAAWGGVLFVRRIG